MLRIGMTAADIPYTPGQPDQGGEGYRFIGYQMYDALINWDLSQGDRLPEPGPGIGGVLGSQQDRQHEVDLLSTPWREVPRWQ